MMRRTLLSLLILSLLTVMSLGCNRASQAPDNEGLQASTPGEMENPEGADVALVEGDGVRIGDVHVVEERIETQDEALRLVQVSGPFEHPWGMAFLPDGRMLVTERPGRLKLVDGNRIEDVRGLPEISSQSQGGLLDVVLHPQYEENGWVYMTFSKPGNGRETATALMRARLDGKSLSDVEELFVQDRFSSPGRHYGSRLAWTWDGKLLMSIGDRGADPPRAQELGDHAGSLLRLNDDGTVPEDNPFVGREDARDEIFARGLRNIQGLVVDIENERIWASDHGPRGGDEINLVVAGENYGWPRQTHGRDYRTGGPFPGSEGEVVEGMVDPVHVFDPAHPPSGLALVSSEHFPNWQGNLLSGGLASQKIQRLVLDNTDVSEEETLLKESVGRVRDVRQGPDGYIYMLVDASDASIYRLESAR